MATIQKVSTKGGARFRALVRRTGQPTITKTFKIRKDAVSWARRLDEKIDRGESIPLDMPVSEVIDWHMARHTGKDPTRISRMSWWKGTIGDVSLNRLSAEQIRKAIEVRFPEQPGTGNRHLQNLSAALQDAVREGWRQDNPCRRVRKAKEPPGRVRFLSDDERAALLTTCRDSEWPHLYLLVVLALSTGARRSELLALTWGDIDFERRVAYVRESKNKERRALPLLPAVVDLIRKVPRHLHDSRLFVPRQRNAARFNMYRYWNKAREAAGLVDFRFHDLRHSTASYLAMNGASLLEIADVLGHKTLAMVKRYSHLSTDHKAALVDRVLGDKV